MRSILFKLSEKESAEFEVVRSYNSDVKLTPKKFFLAAMHRESEKLLAEVEADEEGVS